MGSEQLSSDEKKRLYYLITRSYHKDDKKLWIEALLENWLNETDAFRKELMSNLSPDDAVQIIDYILNKQ